MRTYLEILQRLADHKYSRWQYVIGLIIENAVFMAAIPFCFVGVSLLIDWWLHLDRLVHQSMGWLIGFVLAGTGGPLAIWSIVTQITLGRGTPNPIMPTQKLVTAGPYRYSRNPMALGATLLYLGIAFCIGSVSAVFLTVFGGTLVLAYVKSIEERELQVRLGEEYLAYKSRTPFLMPSFRMLARHMARIRQTSGAMSSHSGVHRQR